MPTKILSFDAVPTLVSERLGIWGTQIKKQRLNQRIQADDLCHRISISDATLRRVERGDPRVSVATYFSALHVLGILDKLAPSIDESVDTESLQRRVRPTNMESDDDF